MRLFVGALSIVVLAIGASPALAGRTHFGWLYGTEMIPERGLEIESWIFEQNQRGDAKESETSFVWGPVWAMTSHVELAVSAQADDPREGPASFSNWGAEVRYRPQSPDPVDAGPFATKFRAGVKRLVHDRAGVRGEANIVASYTAGRVLALVDLGGTVERLPELGETATAVELSPGAGVSVRVSQGIRLGVETYSELIAKGDEASWLVVGPSLSLTSGRIWLAATYGIGVFGIRDAPRITMGFAL